MAASPSYSAAPYGDQNYPPAVQAPRNGIGTAALVVGIVAVLSLITVIGGILLGIVAIILGALGRGRVKRGEATNRGMATSGIVLGIVAIVASIGVIIGGVSLFNHLGGQTLVKCVQQANGDQTKIDQCNQQFQSKNGN